MRTRSPKRAKQEREYSTLRREFLKTNPACGICGVPATEVHHRRGRVGVLLTADQHFMALCHACHTYVTEHPAEAYLRGWSERRVAMGAAREG
jgi:5-methylcytosine-specific restriction endonuclease McrA